MLPAKGGKLRPVKFNDLDGCSDILGQMKERYGGALLAMEVKRPGWNGPEDERELRQANFIMTVKLCGGVAGFVTSPEEAVRLIDEYCERHDTGRG